jgi:hypothetical protein
MPDVLGTPDRGRGGAVLAGVLLGLLVLAAVVVSVVRAWPEEPPGPSAGHRWERFGTVHIEVPDTWADGPLADWCADGDEPAPRVERAPVRLRAEPCTPAASYGVRLEPRPSFVFRNDGEVAQPHSEPWPDDAWVGRVVVGDTQVTVAAPDRATALAVLRSARVVAPDQAR